MNGGLALNNNFFSLTLKLASHLDGKMELQENKGNTIVALVQAMLLEEKYLMRT